MRAYPWLVPAGEIANPLAWTVTFSRYGMPIRIEAASIAITQPVVTWVKERVSLTPESQRTSSVDPPVPLG